MARTPLFAKKTPGGVLAIESVDIGTGSRFYVDSSTGTDGVSAGTSPDDPLATIDYAVGLCTASKGDMIIVMPGHAETVSAASGIDLDVAGIRIIGLGQGDLRPIISMSASASTIEVNADDIHIENIIIEGTFTNGVAAALDVKAGADDLTVKNCVFRGTAATKELLKAVTIEAATARTSFIGCEFRETIGGDATAAIFAEGIITDLVVKDCLFLGDWSAACLELDAGVVVTPYIEGCRGHNADPSAGLFAAVSATAIATFIDCKVATQKANTEPVTDGSASFFIECYGTDVAATSAIIYPATATAWA